MSRRFHAEDVSTSLNMTGKLAVILSEVEGWLLTLAEALDSLLWGHASSATGKQGFY